MCQSQIIKKNKEYRAALQNTRTLATACETTH